MVDWSIVLPAVLGGLISGLVGLGIVEYRHLQQENRELKSWYDKTIRLAERIDNSQPLSIGVAERKQQAPIIRNTCADVQISLANHLAEAPSEVSSELIEKGEVLVGNCQSVKEMNLETVAHGGAPKQIPRGFFEQAREAADTAETVVEKAEKERAEVGWF